jgi:hypothetical protein
MDSDTTQNPARKILAGEESREKCAISNVVGLTTEKFGREGVGFTSARALVVLRGLSSLDDHARIAADGTTMIP